MDAIYCQAYPKRNTPRAPVSRHQGAYILRADTPLLLKASGDLCGSHYRTQDNGPYGNVASGARVPVRGDASAWSDDELPADDTRYLAARGSALAGPRDCERVD